MHDGMRNDFALLRRAVTALADDGDGSDALAGTRFSIRGYCADFCVFVHEHHSVEDAMLFPTLIRQENDPELARVIDRLRADHKALGPLLDEAEHVVAALPGDPAARAAANEAIERLSERLSEHLDFEERSLAPALNRLSRLVPEEAFPAPPSDQFGISGSPR